MSIEISHKNVETSESIAASTQTTTPSATASGVSEDSLDQDERPIPTPIPQDWNPDKDREYYCARESGDQDVTDPRPELMNRIGCEIAEFHGVLDFAFDYLTQGSVESSNEVFQALTIRGKVALLRKRFHAREQGADYVKRFDSILDYFLTVERLCFPILEECLQAPETVWLRELIEVLNCIACAHLDLDESMCCEHPDCPSFHGDVMISPEFLK